MRFLKSYKLFESKGELEDVKVNFDVFGYSIHINIFGGEEIAIKYPF